MPVLGNIKHEQFALLLVKGVSATKAYVSAGYSPKGAQQSAARLLSNAEVCSRVRELQEAVSAATIALEIRKRSARVKVLQEQLDGMLAVQQARRALYADDKHGGGTGQLAKDYRGKLADQVVWKFDAALVTQIAAVMKQAAIEEGQWTEKRENTDKVSLSVAEQRLNAGRDRVAAAKRARDAKK
jgi:phage terminase small subunit